jgi:GDPmannose 4,6-dehydratase
MRLPSEVFGDINGAAADESTPFSPRSSYAVAKAMAFWEVANYRAYIQQVI